VLNLPKYKAARRLAAAAAALFTTGSEMERASSGYVFVFLTEDEWAALEEAWADIQEAEGG